MGLGVGDGLWYGDGSERGPWELCWVWLFVRRLGMGGLWEGWFWGRGMGRRSRVEGGLRGGWVGWEMILVVVKKFRYAG